MKLLRAKARVGAFTLIELLVVVAIIAILWAMITPAIYYPKTRATSAACMNNQKQIALGFLTWASEHDDKPPAAIQWSGNFPWEVSTNKDGTKELISNNQAVSQYLSLADILKDPVVLYCPSDRTREPASKYDSLVNSNISYFVNADAVLMNGGKSILTGDRHLEADKNPVKPGLFVFTNGLKMSWTKELHPNAGNPPLGIMSFCDGHVESIRAKDSTLTDLFDRQKLASARLLVP